MIYDYVIDISKENERLRFREIPAGLSAMVFPAPREGGSIAEAREIALGNALQAIKSGEYMFWLIAGHAYPVRDTPLNAHKRLWRGLEAFGICFPVGDWDDSVRRTNIGEVRYFQFRRLHPDDLSLAEHVCRIVPSFIAIAKNINQVREMVGDGWNLIPAGVPREAFERSLKYKLAIIALLGDFDDPTADAALIASKAVLDDLIHHDAENGC